ncbi:MAG: type IV toxin-antitoxin system AbiEi family antitoxin domain-containing protein [Nocardioides sp.]
MTDLLPALHDPLDVILRREALQAGMTEREIVRLCRSGEWTRVRHGAYMPRARWIKLDERDQFAARGRAVLRQARAPVVLSHTSAVAELGAPLFGLDLRDVHVTRLDQRAGRAAAGVRQHQGKLVATDVHSVRQARVTNATKTALDVLTLTCVESGLCIVNDLLHRGLTTEEQLHARYALMERNPFTLRAGLVLRLADARVESIGESRTYFLCWHQGLPAPVPQYRVEGSDGQLVASLDFAWPHLGVWAEFDGKIKYGALLREGQHPSDVVVAEKKREDRVRELTGWTCIRLTWQDLAQPEQTAARIRRCFTRATSNP